MKRWHKILAGAALVLAAAYYWLLVDNRPGDGVAPLDLPALRAAANGVPGEKAKFISVETIARGELPQAMLLAGASISNGPQGVHSFRVETPGGGVIIDTGMERPAADAMSFYKLDDPAQSRVSQALGAAQSIVLTHEHLDHIGGLLAHWDKARSVALVTKEQFEHPENSAPGKWPEGSRSNFAPQEYEGAEGIAPGVAVMKAPSHTPGSQIVYSQLADGREYLFMGDISSMDRNWRETRARSRLVSDLIVGEDRDAVFAWLKAFKTTALANPKLVMVPTHDSARIDALVSEGAFKRGFGQPTP